MSIHQFLLQAGRTERQEEKTYTFEQYFSMAQKAPYITETATQRLYRMILSHGVDEIEDGAVQYRFFKGKVFGADEQIRDIMMYLKAASMGLDIKKRVLLLLGPPGGGKSQILSMLKKGLSDFSKTSNGALYAIKDCPIHEDPLHLIPDHLRAEVFQSYGLRIEGKLCPACQFRFDKEWNRNLNHVPVVRVFISEENRVGIGTFAPAEKNSMEELYGSANLSTVDYFGNEGDVRAYTFNGELHTANRGIMEFIEVLKAKTSFLHILLTLAEEQQFKTPRFPLQYVDETLIAHTNEGEFLQFIAQKENEAVIDRFFIVRMPYNMEAANEEKIYHAALKTKLNVKGVHVHYGAIRLASDFAILTRAHDNPLREGMSGISPRFILNALALSLVSTPSPVVEPKDMWLVLQHQIASYPVLSQDVRALYLSHLQDLARNIGHYESLKHEKPPISPHPPRPSSMFDLMIGDD